MDSEKGRAVSFVAKRMQAQRNMEQHIQKILFPVAKDIVSMAKKYSIGGKLYNERKVREEAKNIAGSVAGEIERYISDYSLAACKMLGSGTEAVNSLLAGDIHGKSIHERNIAYLANFAEDVVRMVKAGVMMGYSDSRILSAVRTGYKDPYNTSVITKARRKDINIDTPSYGRGVFHNAYANIVRNARQVISLAWGTAEQKYGKDNGATGFRVFRGSSYPCAVCDDECAYVHKLGAPAPPFHINCVCYTQFIYKK